MNWQVIYYDHVIAQFLDVSDAAIYIKNVDHGREMSIIPIDKGEV